jgi:pimeloyl-ACP methyl ester carboxylesterase
VAPAAAASAGGQAVTLYLHEFSFGQFFWRFPVAGYDYARALAERGHASVVVDRLGYDESSHPRGDAVCIGSQADVAHQIVSALRSGDYASGQGKPARFTRVVLGGHSVGGAVAEVEAYSFHDVDGLLLLAQADQDFTPEVLSVSAQAGLRCGAGGEPSDPGGAPGYEYFSTSPEGFRHFSFNTAEQRVADLATAMRNRDPCGDVQSLASAVAVNQMNAGAISLPVFLLYGTADPAYQQPQAGEDQRKLFSGSKDVTLRYLAGQAHALTMERAAPEVQRLAADWLAGRGF